MIDELFDREYQARRSELNGAILGGLGRLADAFSNSFQVLNRIEYSSPWKASASRVRMR